MIETAEGHRPLVHHPDEVYHSAVEDQILGLSLELEKERHSRKAYEATLYILIFGIYVYCVYEIVTGGWDL